RYISDTTERLKLQLTESSSGVGKRRPVASYILPPTDTYSIRGSCPSSRTPPNR
ncbi:hypothetical protein J6590_084357, partial [Homalodisca vitripennis]